MRVYEYRERIALESLCAVERPDPEPGPRDVVVRMRAVALNYRDLAIVRGTYHARVSPPLIPLSDGAGEVVEIGDRVTRFRVGDLVCPTYLPDWIDGPIHPDKLSRRLGGPNDGVLRELFCIHENELVRAPAHLDATEAAALPVAWVTAWHALYEAASLRPGETLLVRGSGGVSLAALQMAHAGGVRVIDVVRTTKYEPKLRALSAEVLACGDATNWPEQVLAKTGERGVDVAVEVAGGASLAQSIRATRLAGRVHVVGYAAETTASLDIFEAIRHGVTLHVATAGSRASFEALVRALEMHRIRPIVDNVFSLSELTRAFEHLATGGHFGKVVVELP